MKNLIKFFFLVSIISYNFLNYNFIFADQDIVKNYNVTSEIPEGIKFSIELFNYDEITIVDPDALFNDIDLTASPSNDDISISFTNDSDLKAGFVVKIGDEVLDLSIKGRIKKLINQLNI